MKRCKLVILVVSLASILLSGCSSIKNRGIQTLDEGYLSNLVKEEKKDSVFSGGKVKSYTGKWATVSTPVSADTFHVNGQEIIFNKTTLAEARKIFGVEKETSYIDGDPIAYIVFLDDEDSIMYVRLTTTGMRDTDVVIGIKIIYSGTDVNEFVFDELPCGLMLEDVIQVYGEPDESDSGSYTWNLSKKVKMLLWTYETTYYDNGYHLWEDAVVDINIDYDVNAQ